MGPRVWRRRWLGHWLSRPAGWVIAVLAVLAVSVLVHPWAREEPNGGPSPSTVRVDRGPVTAAVAATGSLRPAQTRGLTFRVDGTVTEIRVRPGDQVTVGQVLARIDGTDAAERVDRAQVALDAAEEALVAAEADDTEPGQCQVSTVYTAGGSAAPTPSGSPAPTPSGPPAPSPTPGASPTAPRTTQPPPGGAGSCAAGGGQGAGADPVLRAEQQVISARVQLAEAEERLAGTTITAPIAGKVLSVGGAVGSRVSAGGSFVTLGVVAEMQVRVDFPEADAARVAVGQPATVTLANRPSEAFPATVTQVDPTGTVDGQLVRFGVLLAFAAPPGNLLVGQTAGVRVEVASAAGVLRVPAGAVHGVADGTGTVLVRTGGADQRRTVRVGLVGDQYVEIGSGVDEGDLVLANW